MKDWQVYGSNSSAGTGGSLIASGTLPNNGNVNAETFSNSSFYTFYTLNITGKYGANNNVNIREIEMMEDGGNVTNEYVSICDEEAQKTNTSSWSNISSGTINETLDSQSAYYWLSFDPTSNFGNGAEIKIFNPTGSVWRKIARNNTGTWEYNNDSTDTAAEDWVASTINDMLHATSQAIATQSANRMTGTNLAGISDAHWEETEGWSTSIGSLIRGTTLYSNSASQNPLIFQYRLNYDSERGSMELFSKSYDPGFVASEAYIWSRVEHSNSDGPGAFSVSRNGGSDWQTIPMVQQGLPLSGDFRILRGTVNIDDQASGQDLLCRYQTEQGKDQFIHSWGLQAKP